MTTPNERQPTEGLVEEHWLYDALGAASALTGPLSGSSIDDD